MNKKEKQYNELKKRFNITPQEFLNYYNNVRKANKKGAKLKKQSNALYGIKFSTEIKHIKNRKDFEKYTISLNNVLQENYRTEMNKKYKSVLYDNLKKMFGTKGANYLSDKLNRFSDVELKEFFDDNDDLTILLYDSDTQIGNFVDYKVSNFSKRIDKFKSKKDVN